jgi:phosphohistidine phosphatase SixA
MKRRWNVLACGFVLLFLPGCRERIPPGAEGTTIILLRHAEKVDDSENPPLSAAGLERSRLLAEMLSRTEVAALFSSQFQRTQQTLEPLAQRVGLNIRVVEYGSADDLVEMIVRGYPRKVSVVASHTTQIPRIIERLGAGPLEAIDERVYDDLFVITVLGEGRSRLVRLKYGEPTPFDGRPSEGSMTM